jgi:hypothetical protein
MPSAHPRGTAAFHFLVCKKSNRDHNLQQLHLNVSANRLRRNGRGAPPNLRYVPRAGSASPGRFLSLSVRGLTANVFYGELTVKSSQRSPVVKRSTDLTSVIHTSTLDPRRTLIERVISSNQFRASVRLREFLHYISECAIKGSPEEATEQQIGVHVFNRLPGYNSSEDSIVRTHARLLRQKLAEYFSTDGLAESTIIEVPKGHYLPIFRPRHSDPVPGPFPLPAEAAPERAKLLSSAGGFWRSTPLGIALGILCVLVLAGFAIMLPRAWPKAPMAKSPIERFWAPFLTGDPPVVIYSNARFSGDSRTGLRYIPSGDSPKEVVDHYTGIGELASVYELTRLFDSHQATFVLKRSLLVTWDEAKLRNLVFIGSPAENPSLNAVPSMTDFTLTTGVGYSGFANRHPLPGEPDVYSRPEHPLTMDYAVIALMPGVQSGKRTLIFSGLTTLGTQAAVEYVCRKENVGELTKVISSPSGELRPFEALLAVTLEGGVPLQSKLISVRVH